MLPGAAFVLYAMLSQTLAVQVSDYCICTRHVETRAFPCMDTQDMPSAFLYGNTPDEDCMPVVPNVISKHLWKAGILNNQVVYVQMDYNVAVRSCRKVAKGPFTFDNRCPPTMKPGTVLNPTQPTTSSSTTTTTTTTPTTRAPVTTTSLPTTSSTTAASSTTSTAPVTVPVHVSASTKCALPKLLLLYSTKTPASHPQGKLCNDQTRRGPDALVLEACLNANPDPYMWNKELKVLDHCYNIPKGEPITMYVGPRPLGIYALFWKCLGNSFEVMYQPTCGSPPIIEDATNKFQIDLFFTISW